MIRQLRFCDASDRVEPHLVAAHLSEVPVLPWLQIKHPALVVWLLEHQPVAFHHVAGLHVGHVVVILDGVAVVGEFLHLPFEVCLLVDPHLVGSLVLSEYKMSR